MEGGSGILSATPPQPRFSSHTMSARSKMYGIHPIWPSEYASFKLGKRTRTPENKKSTTEKVALVWVRVEPTAGGASAEVDGIFDDEPMCMLTTVLVSAHARKNG